MRYVTLLIPLVVAGGLLIGSQALAAGQIEQGGPQMKGVLSGEQLHQWKQVQERLDAENQMQTQQLSAQQITAMQSLLTMHGYYVGAMNGILDENTKTAIRHFQQNEGLAITSMPNEETLRALVWRSDQEEFFGLSPEFGSTDYTNENCCP
jgi:murein L,D-transpeptidase YcbB/YkuD